MCRGRIAFWLLEPSLLGEVRSEVGTCSYQMHSVRFTHPLKSDIRPYCNGKPAKLSTMCSELDSVLELRLFPLKGGVKSGGKGKRNDEVVDKLADVLVARGVAPLVVHDRVQKVFDAVGKEWIAKHISMENFWVELKQICTEKQVRLVFPSELRSFQMAKKGEDSLDGSRPARSKPFKGLNPDDLVFPADDFRTADGMPVQRILPASFQADRTGYCLMSPDQAKLYLPPRCMSPDGLAIVTTSVVVNDPECIYQFSAMNKAGEALLVRGNIFQFGELEVQYAPQCPNAEVKEIESSVIELIVHRDSQFWGAAMTDPFSALTQVNPDLAKHDVFLAKWKFRVYTADRQVVQGDSQSAQHIHGYARVNNDALDAVLSISGCHNMFIHVHQHQS